VRRRTRNTGSRCDRCWVAQMECHFDCTFSATWDRWHNWNNANSPASHRPGKCGIAGLVCNTKSALCCGRASNVARSSLYGKCWSTCHLPPPPPVPGTIATRSWLRIVVESETQKLCYDVFGWKKMGSRCTCNVGLWARLRITKKGGGPLSTRRSTVMVPCTSCPRD